MVGGFYTCGNRTNFRGALDKWEKVARGEGLQAVEGEIASLKKSVSDGKTLVAGAITGKGITTATDAAFATMADNISQISTLAADTADATATAAQILAGAKAYVKGSPVVGTMPNNGGPSTAIAAGKLKAGYTEGGDIANLSAGNIKEGITIGGIRGNLSDMKVKQGSVTVQHGDSADLPAGTLWVSYGSNGSYIIDSPLMDNHAALAANAGRLYVHNSSYSGSTTYYYTYLE